MDDITRMFLDITPEDFFRDTSATTVIQHTDEMVAEGMTVSETNFNHFVNAMLIGTKTKATEDAPTEDGFAPFSVLHNMNEQRYFRPDDDETPVDYARRLNWEAAVMDATWFFNAMLGPGRAFDGSDINQPLYEQTQEGIVDAVRRGILEIGICWTAAFREGPKVSARRGGIIYLGDDGAPIKEVEGKVTPATDVFHLVLGDE